MGKVEHYSFFCEDIRWEANGSPMFAGLMSPVFSPAEYPITFNRIILVSFFRAPQEVDGFTANLKLFRETNDSREEIGDFGAEYLKAEHENEGHQWIAISHLPIAPIELSKGESLVAEVDCEGDISHVYLTGGSLISLDA